MVSEEVSDLSEKLSVKRYDRIAALAVAAAVSSATCSSASFIGPETGDLECGMLDPVFLADGGVGRDGIPALTDPRFVTLEQEGEILYLTDSDRVIGVEVGGDWLAIPHNVMYRHEIVNLNRGGEQIAVTYCPLTGSALAFDRSPLGGVAFGVSGLLYQANLIMYDRSGDDSLWPQMAGVAGCGPREGERLVRRAVVEMTWGGFKALFPRSLVAGIDSANAELYSRNPYGNAYETPDNPDYLGFPIPRVDDRRPPKERVLGFPGDERHAPLAFPFQWMATRGDRWVVEFEFAGSPAIVLWDNALEAAVGARPVASGRRLAFEVRDGAIVDTDTGSVWSVGGEAVAGPLRGERLELIADTYVAFWQAWAAYHPGTELPIG